MNFDNMPTSTNIEGDCLGYRIKITDPQFDSVMKCQDEVRQLRATATSTTQPNDIGVTAVRDGVLQSLLQGNVHNVEKFLKYPTMDNIPSTAGAAFAALDRPDGTNTTLEHTRALVRAATDLLKSPSGTDLVLQYDHLEELQWAPRSR